MINSNDSFVTKDAYELALALQDKFIFRDPITDFWYSRCQCSAIWRAPGSKSGVYRCQYRADSIGYGPHLCREHIAKYARKKIQRIESNTCDFNTLLGERCKQVAKYWRVYEPSSRRPPRPCRCCFSHKKCQWPYGTEVSPDAPDRTAEYEAEGNRLIFIDDETPYARLLAEILEIKADEPPSPNYVWKRIEFVK